MRFHKLLNINNPRPNRPRRLFAAAIYNTLPANLPPSPRHPQGAGGGHWLVVPTTLKNPLFPLDAVALKTTRSASSLTTGWLIRRVVHALMSGLQRICCVPSAVLEIRKRYASLPFSMIGARWQPLGARAGSIPPSHPATTRFTLKASQASQSSKGLRLSLGSMLGIILPSIEEE